MFIWASDRAFPSFPLFPLNSSPITDREIWVIVLYRRRQKAEGRRQKAEGRSNKIKGSAIKKVLTSTSTAITAKGASCILADRTVRNQDFSGKLELGKFE